MKLEILPTIHTLNSLFKGPQVLVADGDNLNKVVMQKLLQRVGYKGVFIVASGHECLNAGGLDVSSF